MKIKWNSLSDVKNYLESSGDEKVISFNGYSLVSDKAEYGLLDGKVRRTEIFKQQTRKTRKKNK